MGGQARFLSAFVLGMPRLGAATLLERSGYDAKASEHLKGRYWERIKTGRARPYLL
ncbi:hypothetical protein X743_11970 [Mesorhizobium sp. LNHC252B00]|nr:hypothetical protein X743_11970 [Mesorhizobium sp. LNHC252B00]